MISKDGRKPGSDVGSGQLLTLEHLRKFVVVAEELSFTRASRRLHVVQSAVSSAIQGLERELGAPLFDRDRHRVALTDAGQALLPEARATLAAAQAAMDAVAQARAGLRGTLTVGTMVSIGTVDVGGLLGRFNTTHPGVSVHLRHAPAGSAGLAAQVIAGELDLALVALPGPARAAAAAADRGTADPHRGPPPPAGRPARGSASTS